MNTTLKTVIGTMRPPFLLLPIAMMILVAGLATYDGYDWSMELFLLILLGAVASNISVNMLNEYEDAESGLDDITERTPFSGGSGSLQQHPDAQQLVGKLGYFFLGLVVSLGVFFVYLRGWEIIPIGLLGAFLIAFYTSNITRMPWLCLIAPGLAFGPLMIVGGYFVLTGSLSWTAVLVSLIPFFLVNNLLLLNQFPDEKADKEVGRWNIIMKLGRKNASLIFVSFALLSFITLAYLMVDGWLPFWAGLGFLPLLLALPMIGKVKTHYNDMASMMPALGMNVGVNLLVPSLIGVGLMLSWS